MTREEWRSLCGREDEPLPNLFQWLLLIGQELIKLLFYTVFWLMIFAGMVIIAASFVYVHVLAHRDYGWLGLYWTLGLEVLVLAAAVYLLRCALLTPDRRRP